MKLKACAYLLILGSLTASVAYAAAGLWGEVDEPMEAPAAGTPAPLTPDSVVPKTPPKKAAEIKPAAPKAPDQKTTCEIFKAQKMLSPEGMNTLTVKEALRVNTQALPVEYKAMLAKSNAMDELYKQYRDLYLKKYCL